jgi:26S proteasome regulatory subunit N10
VICVSIFILVLYVHLTHVASVELLVSPTEDLTKINACFARVRIGGTSDFVNSVQIAQIALKHRKNKNGGQRIIAFVGSPITETVEAMQKIGKVLRKGGVAIDVISLGEQEENLEKLTEFVNAANSSDNR